MDSSYLFDARPLLMTQAGKIQNYLGEEPKIWQGINGQRSLATRLVDKLAPYRNRFSVINGIIMTTAFDGHPQNINCMFSGSPFGGDCFIPHLNQGQNSPLSGHDSAGPGTWILSEPGQDHSLERGISCPTHREKQKRTGARPR